MSRLLRKNGVLLAALLVCVFIVSACSEGVGSKPKSAQMNEGGSAEATPDVKTRDNLYPLPGEVEISYWMEASPALLSLVPTYGELPFYKELEKVTGVRVEYKHPAANQAKEQLNVMLASGQYADVMEWNWRDSYPGGPEKAIKDGNILRLNDLIDEYAPNLKAYLAEHPEVDKQIKTDNGSYYGFPFIRGDDYLKVYQGPILRKDWLDELELAVPTTIEEWYTMLKAFKEHKNAEAPLTMLSQPRMLEGIYNGAFVGAFGTNRGFYVEDGEVKFGPAQQAYKAFLATFRQWYEEGLLDRDIATIDKKIIDKKMTSGRSGAAIENTGGGIGKWTGIMADKNTSYELVSAPYPVLRVGERPMFGQLDSSAPVGGLAAISPKSKHPELIVQYLDYAYSKEGSTMFNFGIEGVSYELVDGNPIYTDSIKDDFAINLGKYTRATFGPTIQDKRYMEQFAAYDVQREALVTWAETDAAKYNLPPISPTLEESTELAKIMNEINTLVDETTIKIIIGQQPLDSFDDYLSRLNSLKIERALEIQQEALQRYNNR